MKNIDPMNIELFVADLETTVDDDAKNQTETECWAAALCPVLERPEPSDVFVYNNIYNLIDRILTFDDYTITFFHNAKFDLSFILNVLDNQYGYEPCYDPRVKEIEANGKVKLKYGQDWQLGMMPYSYKLSISDMGQWYGCTINTGHSIIEIRDSAKKMPMTLKKIGEGFATKYQKLDITYTGKRTAFGVISDKEDDYIRNDVLILSEAMYKVWYDFGMTGVTIGSDCMTEFKRLVG